MGTQDQQQTIKELKQVAKEVHEAEQRVTEVKKKYGPVIQRGTQYGLTMEEMANVLGVSLRTIYNLKTIKKGK